MAENKKTVHAALEKSISNITGTLLPLFDAKGQKVGQAAAKPDEEHSAALQDAQKKFTAAANALQKYSAACLYSTVHTRLQSQGRSTKHKKTNSCSGV